MSESETTITLADEDGIGLALDEIFKERGYPLLKIWIRTGRYVSKRELAEFIRANPGVPIPAIVSDYQRRLLAGEIKRPGRPGPQYPALDELRIHHFKIHYKWALRREKRRDKASVVREDGEYQAPNIRAAKYICERFFKRQGVNFNHVQNLLSTKTRFDR